MKDTKLILLFFIVCILFSCKQNTQHAQELKKNETDSLKATIYNSSEKKVEITSSEFAKDCNQTFDEFFDRFAKDSVFQKERVKYPMEWSYYGEANYQELITEIVDSKQKFRYFDFTDDKNAINREYGAFEVNRINHIDSVIYQRIGLDTGLLISFKFQLIDNCWYLVSIVDKST